MLYRYMIYLGLAALFSEASYSHDNRFELQSKVQFPEIALNFTGNVICNTEAHIIKIFFSLAKVTVVTNDIIRTVLDCDSAPLEINTFEETANAMKLTRVRLSVYVLIISSLRDFLKYPEQALATMQRNSEGKQFRKYIVIIESVDTTELKDQHVNETLLIFFDQCFQRNILNVAVIFYLENVQLFSYQPFILDDPNKTIKLVNLTSAYHKNGAATDIFFNKLVNLNKYPINLVMQNITVRSIPNENTPGYHGVDGYVAELLGDMMNANFSYFLPRYEFNGTVTTGNIGEVIARNAEFAFNALSWNTEFFKDVETTNAFERNDICLLVPKSGDEPIFYNLLRTLTKLTWIVITLSLLAMALIYGLIQNTHRKVIVAQRRKVTDFQYEWREVFLITFQSFFGDAITRIPKSATKRSMLISWCIYSFLITNAFTAKLISSLVLPRPLNDIDTLEELGKSSYKIRYHKSINALLNQYLSNYTWNILGDQVQSVEYDLNDPQNLLNNTDSAYMMPNFMAEDFVNRLYNKQTGKPYFHMMSECLVLLPRVYIVEKGSMYLEYVNELLGRFHEMGFIVYWTRKMDFLNKLHGNVIEEVEEIEDESEIQVVISVEHLQTAFYLLVFGLTLATIVFCIELYYFKKYDKNKNNVIIHFAELNSRRWKYD